jgi:hypothetical protein
VVDLMSLDHRMVGAAAPHAIVGTGTAYL